MPAKYTIYRDQDGTQVSPDVEEANKCPPEEAENDEQQLNIEQQEANWHGHKENIQPISQGRKIGALFQALTLIDDNNSRKDLLAERKEQFQRQLEAAKEEGEEAAASSLLDLWCEYIDWLEQNVPDGGKVNQITQAIEQCIESYYDKKEFKQDKRLFNVFMKFKRFCQEPVEVFGFMYANCISTLLAEFYLNWSWQYECMKSMKRAEDLLKLGLKNLASPRDLLVEAESQLKCRVARMVRAGLLDEQVAAQSGAMSAREARAELASSGIRAALQTLKCSRNKAPVRRIGSAVVEDSANVGGLKSQMKLVNGVRVASHKSKPLSNKPVLVCVDEEPSDENSHLVSTLGSAMHLPRATPVQPTSTAGPLSMLQQPTSQSIRTVGRTGSENQTPSGGIMSSAAIRRAATMTHRTFGGQC